MDSLPNLEGQSDSATMISQAKQAIAELGKWTRRHREIIDENEKYTADIAKAAEDASKNRAFSDSIGELKELFLQMYKDSSNPQARGKAFEGFLNLLFGLFDL